MKEKGSDAKAWLVGENKNLWVPLAISERHQKQEQEQSKVTVNLSEQGNQLRSAYLMSFFFFFFLYLVFLLLNLYFFTLFILAILHYNSKKHY